MFLKPIVETLKKFEIGSKLIVNGRPKIISAFLMYGVYDKPARAAANNTVASHGYYGCVKCTQKGEELKNKNSK